MTDALATVFSRLTLIPAALLLFGFLAPWSQAADTAAHFRLHLAVVVVVLGVALLVMRMPLFGTGLVALGVAGVWFLGPVWQHAGSFGAGGRPFTFFQMNLRFDNLNHDLILARITAEKPDAIVFVETSSRQLPLLDALAADYPFSTICPFGGIGGVAILSRHPLAAGVQPVCDRGQGFASLKLDVGGRPVTVVGLHLPWPWPHRQHRQIGVLMPSLTALRGTVVLGGDFNAAPWSDAVERVSAAAALDVVGGLRLSWLPLSLPFALTPWIGLPIDQTLVSRDIAVDGSDLLGPSGSDHRPIVTRLRLPASA